jgi:hypothetical protein
MRLLQNRIGPGDQGTRFSQPKAQPSKHALTLTHAQLYFVSSRKLSLEGLDVPHRSTQAHVARRTPQHRLHVLDLRPAQALWPSGPRAFSPPGKASLLKMLAQHSTDRGASLRSRPTSGQAIPWATSNTPCKR